MPGGPHMVVQELCPHDHDAAHGLWRTGKYGYGLLVLCCHIAVGRGEALAGGWKA